MQDLEAALGILQDLQEDPTQAPKAKVGQHLPIIEAYRDRGLQNGPLGAWWAEWPQANAIVDPILDHYESENAPGQIMDPEALKILLIQRLDEGAPDEAIVAELHQRVLAGTLNQWCGMLWLALPAVVAGMLGIPERHHGRMEALVAATRVGA